jgi:hypothetical protein
MSTTESVILAGFRDHVVPLCYLLLRFHVVLRRSIICICIIVLNAEVPFRARLDILQSIPQIPLCPQLPCPDQDLILTFYCLQGSVSQAQKQAVLLEAGLGYSSPHLFRLILLLQSDVTEGGALKMAV